MLRLKLDDASSNDMDRVGYSYEVEGYRSVTGMDDTGLSRVGIRNVKPVQYSIRQLPHPIHFLGNLDDTFLIIKSGANFSGPGPGPT